MDIETVAKAMFDAAHERFGRRRDWARHPDHDGGQEWGRDTFRVMARAAERVADMPAPEEAEPGPEPGQETEAL